MELPRFRRSRSWIEAYGLDVALTMLLCTSAVVQAALSGWIRDSASFARMLSDVLDGLRFFLTGTLVAVSLVFAARPLLADNGARRWTGLAALVLAASAVGWWIQLNPNLCGCDDPPAWTSNWGIAFLHQVIVIAGTVAGLQEFIRSSRRVADALHAEQLQRVELDGRLAAGRLQVLLAQIEPHFLFNSLANLRRLSRVDPGAGAAMLTDLLRYLESALPRLRDATPTLEREIELARSFLAVHQVRMGKRLAVRFDVEPGLAGAAVPPMMLLTLVENALKHGIGPLPEGGSIVIEARRDGSAIRLRVSDSGRGMGAAQGQGVGLANVRSRLRSLYGGAAQLTLELNDPHGVIASIVLPERRA